VTNLPPHLIPYLPDCACHDRIKLRTLMQRNGIPQYALYCVTRGRRGSFIPKHIAAAIAEQHGIHVDEIPVFRDNRPGCCDGSGCADCVHECCEVCGSFTAVQYHHWAPWYLFGADANDWPTSFLCALCHRRWHSIVTPNMHARQAS
jgi:hypothetical protein